MSKIDLSKAKLGDKFITKEGRILRLAHQGHKYTLIARGCFVRLNQNGKLYEDNEESKFDLVEQVFDNGDQLDNNISVEKRGGEVLAEMTKSEYEKAKELGIDFLQVYIEKNPEEYEKKQERQRRQEVVELAEKLVTNELFAVINHIHDMRELGAAINLDSPAEYAFLIAEEFVNAKIKYLKEGKLC